ncbi:UNVERIFIED_CONTAM: hypothetical protein GTU68_029187 [Idotea baltica]|nr:hypothetical protein [Idotea baltica]
MYTPMTYLLSQGGKRIRPVLLLLSYQSLSGKDASDALNAATAVEFFHNFSLMHDDIMDKAPVRRGKPTVHVKWDENTAILSGDAMFGLSFELLIRNFSEKASELIKVYTDVSVGVCEGQMEDMLMAEAEGGDIPAYLEMIRKKTAVLIGGSMSMGAICAGADPELVERIRVYGELIGTGFQLQDDLLDVYAEQAKFGKQVAGDILENKKTFLLLTAMADAEAGQRERLEALLKEEDPQTKIDGVKAIYAELEIAGKTRSLMATYFDKAEEVGRELSHFQGFEHIEAFFQALIKRDY